MGAINSLVKFLPLVKEGYDAISGAAGREIDYREQQEVQNNALRQLQEQQRISERQLAQSAALEREKMAAEAGAAERKRIDALRRAVARQRASFAGGGVSAGDGSAEAVLLGMFEETDDDRRERERLDDLRGRILSADEVNTRALNVLQYEQLRQRQKLSSLSSGYDRINNAVGTAVDIADMAGRAGIFGGE